MAEVTPIINIQAQATITFNESEMRALDALIGYGIDPFLRVFYEKLGRHYMQPHEAGLRSLFSTVAVVRGALNRMDEARKVYYGEKMALPLSCAPSRNHGQDEALAEAFRKKAKP